MSITGAPHKPGTIVFGDPGKSHRVKGAAGDCTVRSVVIATGLKYEDAYNLLAAAQEKYRTTGFELSLFLKLDPAMFGVVKQFDFPAERGKSRMTPKTFAREHAKGNYILSCANHVVGIEDGVIYDSWDSSSRCVYSAVKIDPKAIRIPAAKSSGAIIRYEGPADSLEGIAKQIDEEHASAESAARSAIEHARRCGELLIAAKEKIGHGGFLAWVGESCKVSDRQARRYMTLARGWEHIAKSEPMSDLTIVQANKLICQAQREAKRPYIALTDELADQINEQTGRLAVVNRLDMLSHVTTDDPVPRHVSHPAVVVPDECPRGGKHEVKTEDGEVFCGKCFKPLEQAPAAKPDVLPVDDEWSIYDGVEYLDRAIRRTYQRWPAKYITTMGDVLISRGREIRETGRLLDESRKGELEALVAEAEAAQ